MLRVIHGNRIERLFEALAELQQEPSANPLEPETIVVQTPGMGRWLTLELARRLGVAANLRFPLPASFVWDLIRRHLPAVPEESSYDRPILIWRIMELLPRCLDKDGFEPLRSYLEDGLDDLKCYQLCLRIADLFDQYLVFRPDWVRAWEIGGGGDWQAVLWRELVAEGGSDHRAALIYRYLERLEIGNGLSEEMPKRIVVFGMAALPPLYLRVLESLGRHTDVHLFVLNPCLSYWGDIVDPRRIARLQKLWRNKGRRDVSDLYAVGNSLLASWGKVTRDTLELVHETGCEDDEVFDPNLADSLLGSVQGDLLLLQEYQPRGELPLRAVAEGDRSIEVHVCHSPLREVEVLYDQLLALLDNHAGHPDLRPSDIVVMMPDIDTYAPYIDAVFGAARDHRRIPWSVADRSPQSEHPVARAFLQLLRLPTSRFESTEIAAILEVPSIRRGAGFDDGALENLLRWISESGIRWGLDRAARAAAGIPDSDQNTWEFGLHRLLLGYAIPCESWTWGGISPYVDVEGSAAEDLGRLQSFVDRLGALQKALTGRHSMEQWYRLAADVLDLFDLSTDPGDADAAQLIRDSMDRLVEHTRAAGFTRVTSIDLLRNHLEGELCDRAPLHRFLTGGVTFCRLTPLRSIPFRVVCLIGMDDGVFPGRNRAPGFDLIAHDPSPRRGDRSRREDDRHLFLEALLSAREKLYLSYVGRSPKDSSERLPSVLVSELLDYVDKGFRGPSEPLSDWLRVEHPMQPFSSAYRNPETPFVFSYGDTWLGARGTAIKEAPFVSGPLEAPGEEAGTLSIDALVGFLRNPARVFLRDRLGVSLARYEDELEDTETFKLDTLEDYGVRQAYLQHLLSGGEDEAWFELLIGRGQLPHGAFARLEFDRYREGVRSFSGEVQAALENPLEPLEVDLVIGGFELNGRLLDIGRSALTTYRYTEPKANDLLALWVRHLVLNKACPRGYPRHSRHLGSLGKDYQLAPVENPDRHLLDILQCYRDGLRQPLRFYPRTSFAYAEQVCMKGIDTDKALTAAGKKWFLNQYLPGAEEGDPSFALVTRDMEPLDETFRDTAIRIFAPVLEHLRASGKEKR